jgi:TRAP-type C4-dicarboxylate transport system substrate-binding protein
VLGIVLALGLIPGIPASAQTSGWALPHAGSADGLLSRSLNAFAEDTTARSAGSLVLRPETVAQTADATAQLRSGAVPTAVLDLDALAVDGPLLAMDRVPYLAVNFLDARRLWQVLRPVVEKALASRGLVLLYAVPEAPRGLLGSVLPRSVDDFKGRRLAGVGAGVQDFVRLTGATSLVPAASRDERLGALADGSADLTFASVTEAVEGEAWRLARYYLHAPAWLPKRLVVVNRDALIALPRTTRDALLSAADAARERAWSLAQEETSARLQNLRDRGIRVRRPEVSLLIALEELGRELLLAWSEAAGEEGAALVEAYYTAKLGRR